MIFHIVRINEKDLFHHIRVNKKRFILVKNIFEKWNINDSFLLESIDENYESKNDYIIAKVSYIEEKYIVDNPEEIEKAILCLLICFEILFDPTVQDDKGKKK